jgi:hypothetical protein
LHPRSPSLLFSLLTLSTAGLASAYETRRDGVLLEPRISVGEDFQLGLRSGWALRTWEGFHGAAFLDGEVRPIPEAVRITSSSTFSYQYRETRWSIGPGFAVGRDFSESLAGFAGAGMAFSDAFYWGSNRAPRQGWIGWGEAGFHHTGGWIYWGAALQYRPLPEISPWRVLLQIGIHFGEEVAP